MQVGLASLCIFCVSYYYAMALDRRGSRSLIHITLPRIQFSVFNPLTRAN